MASTDYMTARPPPPSSFRVLFDQRAVPALIDGLGSLEAGFERLANLARRHPLSSVVGAVATGLLAGHALMRGRIR